MTIQDITTKITPILESEGVLKAALFGSVAREEASIDSDIDLLVELGNNKSLLDLVGLQQNLEDTLGLKVDIITYDGIHPLLKDIILNEQKIIYEKKS